LYVTVLLLTLSARAWALQSTAALLAGTGLAGLVEVALVLAG